MNFRVLLVGIINKIGSFFHRGADKSIDHAAIIEVLKGREIALQDRLLLAKFELDELKKRLDMCGGIQAARIQKLERQLANASALVNGLTETRMQICESLRRFGLVVTGDNKIIKGNWNHMPVMAAGIEAAPSKQFSKKKIAIISWFRLVPDKHGKINEEFSHYDDALLDDFEQPIYPKGKVPPPKGGTTFSGNWIWKKGWRTHEQCPKISND